MSPIGISLPLCLECDSPLPLVFHEAGDVPWRIMVCEGCGCWFRIDNNMDPDEGVDGLEQADQESW